MRCRPTVTFCLAALAALAPALGAQAHDEAPPLAAAPSAAPDADQALRRAAARGGGAAVGAATFDDARSAIELPFAGRAPRAFLYRLSPTHYYYEFTPARFVPGGAQARTLGGAIARFTVSGRPPRPAVRVSFHVARATVPAVAIDAEAGRITVLPLGRAIAPGAAPAIVPHGWTLPR